MRLRPASPFVFVTPALIVIVLALIVEAGTASQPWGDYILADQEAFQGAVTVRTAVRFSDEFSWDGAMLAWLGGESGPPSGLRLTLIESRDAWFPTWKLKLESDLGLLDGDIDLGNLRLANGGLYEVVMSYDPERGALGIMVHDLDRGEVVLARGLQINAYRGPLWAGAGLPRSLGGESDRAILEALHAHAGFVPVGVQWQLVSVEGDRAVQVARIDRREPTAFRLQVPWSDVGGEFRFVAEGAGGARELIRTTAAARETLLPLNAAQLPPGRSTLRMEFLIGGEVRLSEERVVNVGLLELHIEDLYVDEARGQIAAKVRAGADGALADVPLTVAAVFSSRLFEGGSLREEELAEQIVFDDRISVSGEGLSIHFDFDLPDLAAFPDVETLKIAVVPHADRVDAKIETAGPVLLRRSLDGWKVVSLPDPIELRRSDIFFSSRWLRPEALAAMQVHRANRMVWTYSENRDFIRQVHESGATFTGAINAGNVPASTNAYCVDLAGERQIAPWQETFVPPQYWADATDPEFSEYLVGAVRSYAAAGADGVHVDDWRMLFSTIWWGGCYTDSVMEAFRAYLRERLDESDLSALGISESEAFDYRRYLAERGIEDSRSYLAQRSRIPVAAHFQEFAISVARRLLLELSEEIERRVDRPFSLSLNANFERTSQEGWFAADLADYFVGESDIEPHQTPVLLTNLALAEAVGTPVVISPRHPDSIGIMRQGIALTYALGQYFIVPWDIWVRGQTERYFAEPEDFAHIYQFIRENEAYFDDYETPSKIGIIVNTEWDDARLGELLYELLRLNVPYTVIAAGSQFVPLAIDPQRLATFSHLVVLNGLASLSAEERRMIQDVVDTSGAELFSYEKLREVIRQERNLSVPALSSVRVIGGSDVYVVTRVKPDDSRAPVVLHVLNRRYDAEADRTVPQEGVRLRLYDSKLWEGRLDAPRLLRPGHPVGAAKGERDGEVAVALKVEYVNGAAEIILPELGEWSLVILD